MTSEASQRSDARDNRARILAVARAAFATDGLDIPIREIARRSGVGPATVYRHFPTKQALFAAAFAESMDTCATILDDALAEPDPWRGFCLMIERLLALHALDRGFSRAFTSRLPEVVDHFAAERDRSLRRVLDLVRRAKETGELRADVVLEDVVLALMANEGIRAESREARLAASRRFAALMIQAFRAQPRATPLPPVARLPVSVR
ncbi:helix-turn-helix domain-containing protein [Pseudonocardia xishanensis]|uniref:TetR/AcrR family transcriptional regulator n=1 Tax=Pseudonocardia xishanensis TaxID=630995 RepID=A0ABP8S2Q5_9PSEU